jgi:hypothetical protein
MELKLSNQAIGAIMLALQRGIMEQEDITNVLKEFKLVVSDEGLVVENPPVIQVDENTENTTNA